MTHFNELETIYLKLETLTDTLSLLSDGLRLYAEDLSSSNAVMLVAEQQRELCEELKKLLSKAP